jgi:uncharacterized protein
MGNNSDSDIIKVFSGRRDIDKSVYRNRISYKERYNWRIVYKYSDLLISCDRDVGGKLKKLVREIYNLLESFIEEEPLFQKSLSPIKIKEHYPPVIKKMCRKSSIFNVGPMATVAGAVCDYIASGLNSSCGNLIIENGGDVFIKSRRDVNVGVYVKNKDFADKIYLKIKAKDTPCGMCSSSGTFGHSLSMGESDLVVVLSGSAISADGAATSIANKINSPDDIDMVIDHYSKIKDIKGILIIKNSRLGVWGNMELVNV